MVRRMSASAWGAAAGTVTIACMDRHRQGHAQEEHMRSDRRKPGWEVVIRLQGGLGRGGDATRAVFIAGVYVTVTLGKWGEGRGMWK